MTTQVRPLAGGAWNAVNLTTAKQARKDTTYGVSLPAQHGGVALLACNQWLNCAGLGTHAVLAQKRAKAVGLQLQEV